MSKILVFFPTYNEAGNVRALISAIFAQLPDAHLLVVDDASPDGTGELLERLKEDHPTLEVVHRPGKLGLGSAHKLAMLRARDGDYDRLITMDADFSHHPKYLPRFVELLESSDFVTGSRYVDGGDCDYGFGRTVISRTANLFAKVALGLTLEENTTMYRGFTADLLRRMDIESLRSEGYSFAVECIHRVGQVTDRLIEFPIHFENRQAGASKISQREIYKAVWTIQRLGYQRLFGGRRRRTARADDSESESEPVACVSCGGRYHLELYPARNGSARGAVRDVSPYSCATHSTRSHGRILKCLGCGLVFMRPKLTARALVEEYASAVDPVYLENIQARVTTFRYNLRQVREHIRSSDRILEIGSYCGAFLKVAREAGLDVTGLEPSAWAANAASKMTDAPVICGTTDDVPPELAPFDVIAAWDVLEHFANPVLELEKIRRLLKDDGTLLFSTLMIDNWFPKMTGRHWPWLMDMHLYYFTESTIRNMLRQTGFELVESRSYCHIVTLEYLLEKLGILGVPFAGRLGHAAGRLRLGKGEIPFRFGDIKLFVCKKAPITATESPDEPGHRKLSASAEPMSALDTVA